MLLVHGGRSEAPLKQMSGHARPRIAEGGEAPMRLADGARQALGGRRRQDQMDDVVGHKTIGPAGDAIGVAALGEKVAIERMVARLGEQQSPAIAALRNVMRRTWDDDAGETRRDARLIDARQLCD